MLLGAGPSISTAVSQLTAIGVHTVAMFAVMAIVAIVVYEKVGLALLRKSWFNLDRVWAAALIAVGVLVPVVAAGQSATAEPPRTAWGDPDLGGVWDFRTITPLERPGDLGDQEFLTEEEAAAKEQEAVERL